ncbi:alpha-L-fucosidase [Pedobacter yulinensis]|uniref:alpha-L-fucosidase n=1 Tax=Pedobacter yulinensis TaxID=2126353 RepID=A0A2T3HGV2_9SPHI|nr:alpha-L-fucosidase [Pedobacter yulinensis]PST81611.1 alpha-L-fucosidase [Pedobacter yulinensis]
MRRRILAICLALAASSVAAQTFEPNWNSLNTRKIPEWFHRDKFGIFIHWGVYAVPAFAPVISNSGDSYSEWYWYRIKEKKQAFKAFHDKNYGADFPYSGFEKSFKAELFDPQQWADVFKKSGARYVVLTSKHHEGYALWPSKEADRSWQRPWNAVTGTPGRDLLGDLTKAVKGSGLKMGYYYSLYEWYNPLWLKDRKRFVAEHLFPQFKDLVSTYKPSLIFSDGEWDLKDSEWRSPELLAWLYNESPVAAEVVVNDRWGSNTREKNTASTYTTSEYGSGKDASIVWEESQGIGHSYGYNRNERLEDYKTSRDLILLLCDIVSRGGNLLLDIGPTADGRIPVIQQQRLRDIGDWLAVNGEAIYGTEAYDTPYQWSEGTRPEQKGSSYMAGYSIAGLTTPKAGTAHIENFFTRKGTDLYCIYPTFDRKLRIRNFRPAAGAVAHLLGSKLSFRIKRAGNDSIIDLSRLGPGDIPSGLFVLKLENALQGR